MKTLLSYLLLFCFTSAIAQDDLIPWDADMEAQSENTYNAAVEKAKLVKSCCADFYVVNAQCLSELSENFVDETLNKYQSGLTQEVNTGDGFSTTRYIYINDGKLKILEKKIWDWGGELFYKNSICPLTEEKFLEELAQLKTN